ncbi:MAG TPA: hypothetical protein VF658_06290 [Pyrinomonadaceae bacterium]|jgi:hypothetical protein
MMKKISLALAFCLLMTACGLTDKRPEQVNSAGAASSTSPSTSNSSGSNPSTASNTGSEPVERPEPTAAQTATLAGGQTVNWDQQGITWTFPAKWKKMDVKTEQFTWSSGDGGFMTVTISPMGESFPADIGLKAIYDQGKDLKKQGKIDELRYLELDGLKGVQYRESPESGDDHKRLMWQAYRKYAGQTQLVNVNISSYKKDFPKHQDEFYAVLYSTKLVH